MKNTVVPEVRHLKTTLKNRVRWYDYGYRFYDPTIARFNSIDRLAMDYPYKSPYDYAENRPINCIDLDGLEAVPIAAAIFEAATWVAGIAITGYISYELSKHPIELSGLGIDMVQNNPGYKEQQKRERRSQRETEQIKQNHAENMKTNNANPTPDGDGGMPKGGGGKIGKIVVGTGLAAEFAKECAETKNGNSQSSDSKNTSNNQNTVTTFSQGKTTNEGSSDSGDNAIGTLPTYTAPADNTQVNKPIILPLKVDEQN